MDRGLQRRSSCFHKPTSVLASFCGTTKAGGQRNPTSCCSEGSWQPLWFAGGVDRVQWRCPQAGTVLWITAGILGGRRLRSLTYATISRARADEHGVSSRPQNYPVGPHLTEDSSPMPRMELLLCSRGTDSASCLPCLLAGTIGADSESRHSALAGGLPE